MLPRHHLSLIRNTKERTKTLAEAPQRAYQHRYKREMKGSEEHDNLTELLIAVDSPGDEGAQDNAPPVAPFPVRLLVGVFDISSLVMVLLSLAVQIQSPFVVNSTNVEAPWPNAVYIPWFIGNVIGFGCGIFGSVIRSKRLFVKFALFMIVVDVILLMNVLEEKNTRFIMFMYFWNAALVHVVACATFATPIKPPEIDAVQLENNRKRQRRGLQVITIGVVIAATLDIVAATLRNNDYEDEIPKHGLPLSRNFYMLWWMVIVIGRLCSIVGALMWNCPLVALGMMGCFVDIALCLFRGITSSNDPNGLVSACLVFIFIFLVVNSENTMDRKHPSIVVSADEEEAEIHSKESSPNQEM